MSSKYRVQDEPLPGSTQRSFTEVPEFDDVHAAIDEAYRRSFIHDCVPSAVYNPQGEFVGRCLGGNWTPASDF